MQGQSLWDVTNVNKGFSLCPRAEVTLLVLGLSVTYGPAPWARR